MSYMNWNYLAGFFDGEGSIARNRKSFRITISQTNEEILNEICDFLEIGYVIKVKKRKSHWKDSWVYFIASKKDVCNFLERVVPYLILKKELAHRTIFQLRQELLEMKRKKENRRKKKSMAKLLRKKGWSYRKIGKKLNIDWGYARRLILDLK